MPILEKRLILAPFMCREFGYETIGELLKRLRDAPARIHANGESEYARALYISPRASVSDEELARYDANIIEHSRALGMTEERLRGWKPYQYLALLFTERYLHRYFGDSEALCADLNNHLNRHGGKASPYMPNGLRTIAFQSATGSGKTLIMHAHILQYRRYLEQHGGRLNNIILLTPNERMSAQHARELEASRLKARLFSREVGTGLFRYIEIIDLNKLAVKRGIKRVAVRDFGENNLVLVDEGHLGASGKVWRERRTELARSGFTFEYSATFNQVTGRGKEKGELLDVYSKCLLFDYTYRQFHADGYGKDYLISNLKGGVADRNSAMYLLGCLLIFYQQCRIWQDKRGGWSQFNLTKPLWVFLGKTVTGGRSAENDTTQSDVIQILKFLGWVLANRGATSDMIDRLLDSQSGLTDEDDKDWFAGTFDYLTRNRTPELYAELCTTLFHGQGRLHVIYLAAGEGELHLKSGDDEVFGVVNVGDSGSLYRRLQHEESSDFTISREAGFADRLFATVDEASSTVNIVIGARRFIAGWNSWRVSTMGLMNVGRSEGPEIIQMFGRGVRLKGYNMSLKRHQTIMGGWRPKDSADLTQLETLYIFGLRADYMETFRNFLKTEGVRVDLETITVPVTWNFGKTDLKIIRIRGNRRYEFSEERSILTDTGDTARPITVDLYSRLQSVASTDALFASEDARTSTPLRPCHIALMNITRIYDRLLKRKQQRGWHTLHIERNTVKSLLSNSDWYSLSIPPERLRRTTFRRLQEELEDIAVNLITEYADRFWRKRRRHWEHAHMEVVELDEQDPNNIGAYRLSIAATAEQSLIADIRSLAATMKAGDYPSLRCGIIMTGSHAYQPLMYAGADCPIGIQPIPLNEDERRVVKGLAQLVEENDACLQGRELFLMRNLSRGKGVSFFDDYTYYPDFIVWLKDGACQHVIFLDPKGLARSGTGEESKIGLYTGIKDTEKRVQIEDPHLFLHAYILSATRRSQAFGGGYSADSWNRKGVYFLDEEDCLRRVIEDVTHVDCAH